MGQAKFRKSISEEAEKALENVDVKAVAWALERLASAASEKFGGDCYLHAALGQRLLADLGVPTELIGGHAGWRVGPGDGDVITHIPIKGPLPPGAHPYHTWLRCGRYLIDFTTYQLPMKASSLDEMDGGNTRVDWAPSYLMVLAESCRSFHEVQQKDAGMYFYTRDIPTENLIKSKARPVDEEDVIYAKALMDRPDMKVMGPNNF